MQKPPKDYYRGFLFILKTITSGSATYTMKFAEYAQVPSDVQEKLLKAYEAEHKEEE